MSVLAPAPYSMPSVAPRTDFAESVDHGLASLGGHLVCGDPPSMKDPVDPNRANRKRHLLNLGVSRAWHGRIALVIDGPNLSATARALGFEIDYRRLLDEFQSNAILLRAVYFAPVIEDREQLSLRPLIDWLDYNGYTVITKVAKEFTDADGRRKVRGNIGVELAVHALELAKHVDQMVLFSGDADFRRLVQALQRRGVRVTVISNISSEPPMIGSDLRRQADVFIDLAEMRSKLGRNRI